MLILEKKILSSFNPCIEPILNKCIAKLSQVLNSVKVPHFIFHQQTQHDAVTLISFNNTIMELHSVHQARHSRSYRLIKCFFFFNNYMFLVLMISDNKTFFYIAKLFSKLCI